MYSDNENDGLFVIGAELFYDKETKELEHVNADLLGIYWEEQIWVVCAKDYDIAQIIQQLPMTCFLGWIKWEIRKEIPLKWLEKNLELYGKLPILEPRTGPPPKGPFFPRATVEFMEQLDKQRSEHYMEGEESVFDYYV